MKPLYSKPLIVLLNNLLKRTDFQGNLICFYYISLRMESLIVYFSFIFIWKQKNTNVNDEHTNFNMYVCTCTYMGNSRTELRHVEQKTLTCEICSAVLIFKHLIYPDLSFPIIYKWLQLY